MPQVIGLRSPHAKVGRIVTFGRTLDKIRLHAKGELPEAYQANLGEVKFPFFDARVCRFLGVHYEDLRTRTLEGGCDEQLLAWAHSKGEPRSDEECIIWNRFMTKLGWRDDRSEVTRQRAAEYGLKVEPQTGFELVDLDEGRPPGMTRSWEEDPLTTLIIMGVAGCGKSTLGLLLSDEICWEFLEADALHPPANIEKMTAGIPLDDADRRPWLEAVRTKIDDCTSKGGKIVVSCSALKDSYRKVLAPDPGPARFIHPRGDYALIRSRLKDREGHFMKENMLKSQVTDLESPIEALDLDLRQEPAVLVKRVVETLGLS